MASNDDEVTFFFSSRLYMNHFLDGYENHREKFFAKIAKIVVNNPLNMETLADISYYLSIEKRGFYVWIKGIEVDIGDLYQYALRKMNDDEKTVWDEIERPDLSERIRLMK